MGRRVGLGRGHEEKEREGKEAAFGRILKKLLEKKFYEENQNGAGTLLCLLRQCPMMHLKKSTYAPPQGSQS